jgi:hypothetical protein
MLGAFVHRSSTLLVVAVQGVQLEACVQCRPDFKTVSIQYEGGLRLSVSLQKQGGPPALVAGPMTKARPYTREITANTGALTRGVRSE